MPFARLEWKPGVDVELTETANRGGWSKSDLIRWREGRAEPVGGWARITTDQPAGIARGLHYWTDLSSVSRFAFGTNQQLYVVPGAGGALTNITPAGWPAGKISSGATRYSLLIPSLDNFGENLLAVASGGPLFQWVPGQTGPATQVVQAPAVNQGMFVLASQQMVMAYGCTPLGGGNADPMLVRWCTQSDYTDWTTSTVNQAGSYRLTRGSRIIGGLQAPNFAMLWTDLDVWIAQYIGFPLVFSFTQIGSNCGLISQKSAAVLGGVPYWMSDHGFFRLASGGAQQLPCSVWDVVFKDLDTANRDKCFAATNYHYSEIYWFFPSLSGGTGEIDSYVKLNVLEGEWDYGSYISPGRPSVLARTAWTDQNQPGDPVSIGINGILYQQESGLTVDGSGAVPAFYRSAFQDIADGDKIMAVDQFIPDFKWIGSEGKLHLTLYFRMFPGDTPTTLGPFEITPTTEQLTLRLPTQIMIGNTPVTTYAAPRAREIAIQIDNAIGWHRMGSPRIRVTATGEL